GSAGAGRKHDQGGTPGTRWGCAQALARPVSRSSTARGERRSGGVPSGCGYVIARGQGLRAQHLQDRSRAPRHYPSTDAGGGRHPSAEAGEEIRGRGGGPMTLYIGPATSRVDGRAKVTGAAKYAAEFNTAGLTHASVVTSTLAKGRIARIEAREALAV